MLISKYQEVVVKHWKDAESMPKPANQYIYVFLDELETTWEAIRGQMEQVEGSIIQQARQTEQPYIITPLQLETYPWGRVAASACARFRRDLPHLSANLIRQVIGTYTELPKQQGGGDREGQVPLPKTEAMLEDIQAIAEYLMMHNFKVPYLYMRKALSPRVVIMLSVIYCGTVIG